MTLPDFILNNSHSIISPRLFSIKMLHFYALHGRKDLPWQQNKTPYSVWVSEIMLQQTQVKTVIPYYLKFMKCFKNIESLAQSNVDDVLTLWAGLGYYSRARNLHRCAQKVVNELNGHFPESLNSFIMLPGIGESTAGAILSLAYQQPEAILDGNVKRVLARVFLIPGWTGSAKTSKLLWEISRKYTPKIQTGDFNQSMMDLGATLCRRSRPLCLECPLEDICLAHHDQKTDEYPHKKPKKLLRKKEMIFLFAQKKAMIFLIKRPEKGIWGGLWCFPEYSMDECVHRHELASIKHLLTHYALQIRILGAKNSLAMTDYLQEKNPSGKWHKTSHLPHLALPAPIKKYLYPLFNL
jgi:A/G-specific adenine glycosylase